MDALLYGGTRRVLNRYVILKEMHMTRHLRNTIGAALMVLGLGLAVSGCSTYDDGHGRHHHWGRHQQDRAPSR